MRTPLAYRAVRGGLWLAAGSYFNTAFGFAANLILTRILAPEDFGLLALSWFFFSLINVRPKIAIGQAFVQRQGTTGELVGTHLVVDFSAGLATVAVGVAAIPLLRAFGYSWDVVSIVLVLTGTGVVESLMATPWALLDKEMHLGKTSLISSLTFPLSYAPAFWLATHGGGYWSIVAQAATYGLLVLPGMWWMARRHLPHIWELHWRFNREVARSLLRFGGTVGLAGLAGMLVGQFDNFLIGSLVGVATLGFYDRAYRIAQWPRLLVTNVISRAAFYTYARLQDDAIRLQKTVTMSVWLITTVALPLALAVFASAPDLVGLLYGERWLPSALFLRLLVVCSVIGPLLEDAGALFVAAGRPRLSLLVATVEAATLIAVGTPLTLLFGAVGTGAAVGISFLSGLVLTYRCVVRVVAFRLWTNLGLPGIAAALTLAGYFLLIRFIDFNVWLPFVRVASKMAYVAISYYVITFAFQPRETMSRAMYVWKLLQARGRQEIRSDRHTSSGAAEGALQ